MEPAHEKPLGALIAVCRPTPFERYVGMGAIVLIALPVSLALVVGCALYVLRGTYEAAIMGGVGLMILIMCFCALPILVKTVRFYEYAAESKTWFRRPKWIWYTNTTEMVWALTRHYEHGVYASTTIRVRLKTDQHEAITFRGKYQEQDHWWSVSLGGGGLKPNEQMEGARDLIAAHITERLLETLKVDGHVRWGKRATIALAGITPLRGRYAGELIPFTDMRSAQFKGGLMRLFRSEDKKPFVTVQCNSANFWPTVHLLESISPLVVELFDAAKSPAAEPTADRRSAIT